MEIEKLGAEISKLVSVYSEGIKVKVTSKLDETADRMLEYVKSNCPKGKSKEHLRDSFIKTEVGNGINKTIYISSKTKGRLVHLIELGFKHRSGKHVMAQPFLRLAMEIFTPKMIEEMKGIIKGEK